MADQHGLMMLFYDLPATTKKDRRAYTRFRKELLKHGYRAFQESVYIKLLRNRASAADEVNRVKAIAPGDGSLSMLPMTISGFRDLTTITGDDFDIGTFADDIICL